MGSVCVPEENSDTSYLHRLILIYQLISKDETLKSTLAGHGVCMQYQAQKQQFDGDSWASCSFCDAHLKAQASADVSALRRHIMSQVSAAAASDLATNAAAEIPPAVPQATTGARGQQVEPVQELRVEVTPATTASTAPSTTEETQQQSDECPLGMCDSTGEASEVSSSSSTAEPLVFAYDLQLGTLIPHAPSGISTPSPRPTSGPLGPPGIPVMPSARAGRIFVDGVFDLLHSGHFNALRQARQLGHCLVVGVNSDIETYAAKGCWPIYTQEERAEIVASCKWVDEVVVGTPYEVSTELLDTLSCEAAAHGDDWVVGVDGRDAYARPRAAGRMVTFKRTEGISSTCITRRLLEATAHMCEERVAVDRPQSVGHFARQALQGSEAALDDCKLQHKDAVGGLLHFEETQTEKAQLGAPLEAGRKGTSEKEEQAPHRGAEESQPNSVTRRADWSVFMSSKRLLQFIGEAKKPKPGDRVVYVDGSFDVLHVGHVRILKIAKEMGDYLIVGIHDDATVSAVKGPGFPVMNVNERALNVLAMRMVDEVIIGAPWKIPKYLLQTFGIHIVVRGTRIDCIADPLGDVLRGKSSSVVSSPPCEAESGEAPDAPRCKEDDPYRVPKELGIYREVESFSSWTTKELVTRLIRNRQALSESLRNRELKETHFWQTLRGRTTSLTTEL